MTWASPLNENQDSRKPKNHAENLFENSSQTRVYRPGKNHGREIAAGARACCMDTCVPHALLETNAEGARRGHAGAHGKKPTLFSDETIAMTMTMGENKYWGPSVSPVLLAPKQHWQNRTKEGKTGKSPGPDEVGSRIARTVNACWIRLPRPLASAAGSADPCSPMQRRENYGR